MFLSLHRVLHRLQLCQRCWEFSPRGRLAHPAGPPGRGRSSVRSVFQGQFNVWPRRNQVSEIIPQFAFLPLIMALISSSLLAAPFTFQNAIFIGVWSFPMSYRGTSPAVWRSGPDTTLLLLGSDILPRTVSSGEAPNRALF